MNALDQEIIIAVNEQNAAAVDALKKRVYYEFWETKEGQALNRSADREAALDRLLAVFDQRYANASVYPGVLFIHRLVDCAADLLAADPTVLPEVEQTPSAQLSEHDEIRALAEEFRRDMEDPKVLASDIRQRRESSVKHRKAWALANTPDVVPTSQILPNNELKKFAHCVNDAVRMHGIASLKPRAGTVVLEIHEKRYEFDAQEFSQKYEQAVAFGLIQ